MAYFIGQGYSDGFTAHMAELLSGLGPDSPVRLTVGTDAVCGACPNNKGGTCDKPERVAGYDRAVLTACGLEEGSSCPSDSSPPWYRRGFLGLAGGRKSAGTVNGTGFVRATPAGGQCNIKSIPVSLKETRMLFLCLSLVTCPLSRLRLLPAGQARPFRRFLGSCHKPPASYPLASTQSHLCVCPGNGTRTAPAAPAPHPERRLPLE